MTTRAWSEPEVWTNGLYLIPAALYVAAGAPTCGLVVSLAALASTAHHRAAEDSRVLEAIDIIVASFALAFTLSVASLVMGSLEVAGAIVIIIASLIIKQIHHVAWHIAVLVGQLYLVALLW